MSKKPRAQTFAEMVGEPTWSERPVPTEGAYAVRPGAFNLAGELFAPDGQVLRCTARDITPRQAKKLVLRGALVAHEGCGCGGGYSDCGPVWVTAASLEQLPSSAPPEFVDGQSPTWIDAWKGEDVTVVFTHGDVEWAGRDVHDLA